MRTSRIQRKSADARLKALIFAGLGDWTSLLGLLGIYLLANALGNCFDRAFEAPPGTRRWVGFLKLLVYASVGAVLWVALFRSMWGVVVLLGALGITAAYAAHRVWLRRKSDKRIREEQWAKDCVKWHGRVLTGKRRAWRYVDCNEGPIPVDETTPEFYGWGRSGRPSNADLGGTASRSFGGSVIPQDSRQENGAARWQAHNRMVVENAGQKTDESVSPPHSPAPTTGPEAAPTDQHLRQWMAEVDRKYSASIQPSDRPSGRPGK